MIVPSWRDASLRLSVASVASAPTVSHPPLEWTAERVAFPVALRRPALSSGRTLV